ncbi:hypothetical protein [Methylocystis parvus]|uniref:Uncharacterized protein n=1 Tax=Methylocystis parvus TaxID=134 RepID=A0A6B8LZP8_9HYPH|nr:hypothetical protein [Methylocystis parvus]QGM96091.1 hypothetical protein F7D14_00325 [Methylocystis parvus]WBK00085.1 hypothetical protein MMG94_19290 [Methylocystis parvus OBBP]
MRRISAVFSLCAVLFASTGAAYAECPPGFELKEGRCDIKRDCPSGYAMRDGHCVPSSACPYGTQFMDGFCVTKPQSGGSK